MYSCLSKFLDPDEIIKFSETTNLLISNLNSADLYDVYPDVSQFERASPINQRDLLLRLQPYSDAKINKKLTSIILANMPTFHRKRHIKVLIFDKIWDYSQHFQVLCSRKRLRVSHIPTEIYMFANNTFDWVVVCL